MEKSVAHKAIGMNLLGEQQWPDGLVPWRPEQAPDVLAGISIGRLKSCQYCGSMHPTDLANALRNGATLSWADFKYGWPHKAYVDDIPNPHAGMIESRTSTSHPTQEQIDSGEYIQIPTGRFSETTGQPTFTWAHKGEPAGQKTHGKFYTVHLQDACQEDRELIERHMGFKFSFGPDDQVRWAKYISQDIASTQ